MAANCLIYDDRFSVRSHNVIRIIRQAHAHIDNVLSQDVYIIQTKAPSTTLSYERWPNNMLLHMMLMGKSSFPLLSLLNVWEDTLFIIAATNTTTSIKRHS